MAIVQNADGKAIEHNSRRREITEAVLDPALLEFVKALARANVARDLAATADRDEVASARQAADRDD